MNETTRIDIFDRCAAAIFAPLYERFPVRTSLRYSDVPEELFEEEDSSAIVAEKFIVYDATIRWLKNADFIWTGYVDGMSAEDVVLTPKGLEILKLPSSIEKASAPIGRVLIDAVKNGAANVAQNAASTALTAGFKLLVGQIASGTA